MALQFSSLPYTFSVSFQDCPFNVLPNNIILLKYSSTILFLPSYSTNTQCLHHALYPLFSGIYENNSSGNNVTTHQTTILQIIVQETLWQSAPPEYQEHEPVLPQTSIPLRCQLCPKTLNSHTPYYSQISCLPALNHEEKVPFQKSTLGYQIPFLLQAFNCNSVSR